MIKTIVGIELVYLSLSDRCDNDRWRLGMVEKIGVLYSCLTEWAGRGAGNEILNQESQSLTNILRKRSLSKII